MIIALTQPTGAPVTQTIPSLQALEVADYVMPNAQAWRQQAEELEEELSEQREEIARLQDEIERLNNAHVYEVTAYTAGYESTQKKVGDPGYGITASGTKAAEGRSAACPPSLSFGTIVEIEGLGERVCEDRGGAIKDGHLDVYFNDLSEAQNFGRQKRKVVIK